MPDIDRESYDKIVYAREYATEKWESLKFALEQVNAFQELMSQDKKSEINDLIAKVIEALNKYYQTILPNNLKVKFYINKQGELTNTGCPKLQKAVEHARQELCPLEQEDLQNLQFYQKLGIKLFDKTEIIKYSDLEELPNKELKDLDQKHEKDRQSRPSMHSLFNKIIDKQRKHQDTLDELFGAIDTDFEKLDELIKLNKKLFEAKGMSRFGFMIRVPFTSALALIGELAEPFAKGVVYSLIGAGFGGVTGGVVGFFVGGPPGAILGATIAAGTCAGIGFIIPFVEGNDQRINGIFSMIPEGLSEGARRAKMASPRYRNVHAALEVIDKSISNIFPTNEEDIKFRIASWLKARNLAPAPATKGDILYEPQYPGEIQSSYAKALQRFFKRHPSVSQVKNNTATTKLTVPTVPAESIEPTRSKGPKL